MKKIKKQQRLKSCECGCGELLLKYDLIGRERMFINGHNNNGKGVGYSSSNGYITKKIKKHPYNYRGYVYEHRLIVEEYYTRKWFIPFYIHTSVDVHHKNRNKLDNRIENLLLIGKSDHTHSHNLKKEYKKIDMTNRFCLFCHSNTTELISNMYNRRTPTYRWYKYNNGYLCKKCYKNVR